MDNLLSTKNVSEKPKFDTAKHGGWQFRNAFIQDPDGYQIVLGAMREVGEPK